MRNGSRLRSIIGMSMAKSARVSDLEWESANLKEQLAQLREDLLRTNSTRLVEARNGETEKTAELTDQMRRLHDGFGSTERQNSNKIEC